jgi:uncharacterized protein GlcG (DUF336 family)
MSEYVITTNTLALRGARVAVDAAIAHAEQLGVAVCVVVADRGGDMLAFARMDGAPILSTGIAQDKAYTVAAFNGIPTHEWWPLIESEPALRNGIVHTPRLVVFGGGVALRPDGQLVGAIGVSGGTAGQDREIAEAAAAALD